MAQHLSREWCLRWLRLATGRDRSFQGNVISSAAVSGLGLVVGIGTASLLARGLGSCARGEFAAINGWATFLGGIVAFGLPAATTFFSSRSPRSPLRLADRRPGQPPHHGAPGGGGMGFAADGPATAPPMLRYGAESVLASLPSTANRRLDQMIMAALIDPRVLGLYVVAVSLTSLLLAATSPIASVLMPHLAVM